MTRRIRLRSMPTSIVCPPSGTSASASRRKEVIAMAADPLARHYAVLAAPGRFALLVEAMARGDEADADRLEDTCPTLTYRGEDVAFRGRMVRGHLIAVRVCLDLRAGLAELRMAATFRQTCRPFAV